MAVQVSEIMNRELFSIQGSEDAREVLTQLVTLGISATPVVADDLTPLGVVSLSDLARHQITGPAGSEPHAGRLGPALLDMTTPPTTIPETATIREAAERLADENRRHLVVVDGDGRAVGFLSALDVVRGLIGRPTGHPEGFPRYDPASKLVWSNPARLDADAGASAPHAPGVVRLLHGGMGQPEIAVWAEVTGDVRSRIEALAHGASSLPASLLTQRREGSLRYQIAIMAPALPPGS